MHILVIFGRKKSMFYAHKTIFLAHKNPSSTDNTAVMTTHVIIVKLGPHDARFVFVMRHDSRIVCMKKCVCHSFIRHMWFASLAVNWHIKANCMCQIRQIFLNTFTHDAPQIRTTHRVDPVLYVNEIDVIPAPFPHGSFYQMKALVLQLNYAQIMIKII